MKLWITEYNNYGDVSVTTQVEPSNYVQHVPFGEISDPLHRDTRAVSLFADMPCLVQFIPEGGKADIDRASPLAEEYEINRAIHMGGNMRVAVWPRD